MVFFTNTKKVIHIVFQFLRIVFPNHTAKENTHGIETNFFCPGQFLVNLYGVVSSITPHLYLIDSSGRIVVTTHQPWQLGIPGIGLFFCPSFALSACFSSHNYQSTGQNGQDSFVQMHLHILLLFCYGLIGGIRYGRGSNT